MYDSLPIALAVLDENGRVVSMNHAAMSLWRLTPAQAAGQPAAALLALLPDEEGPPDVPSLIRRALESQQRVPCFVVTPPGSRRPASLIAVPLRHHARSLTLVGAVLGDEPHRPVPSWALRDPLTGLLTRPAWEELLPSWQRQPGSLILLDVDDLKHINDLYGHPAGDRALALVGRTLARMLPDGAVGVRYGGDEFLLVLPSPALAAAHTVAKDVLAALEQEADTTDLPLLPSVSYGVAAFQAGGIGQALEQADESLYEDKGVVLRAASGGRLILNAQARGALRAPSDRAYEDMWLVSRMGEDFDRHFRTQYAHAAVRAREFVEFVDVRPGVAAVEVGAGAGRITFDGGLAERIGPTGQLLVTDPSAVQLRHASRRAHELGYSWLRFLVARAERLPLGSGTADLCLGALFLHFTDGAAALREMARVVRPGGVVAVSTDLPFPWGPVWEKILAPILTARARPGLPPRHVLPSQEAVEGWCAAAGLVLERKTLSPTPTRMNFPSAEAALAFWRQGSFWRLLLRDVPPEEQQQAENEAEERLQQVLSATAPEDRALTTYTLHVVARRPQKGR